jgi:hypothetical protein
VALWLTDHQMNMMVSVEFGEYFVRLPLKKSAKITHGNALRTDWGSLIEPLPWETASRFDYVFGNPPFIGSKMMTQQQRKEVAEMFDNAEGCGILDYVTAWYAKAAKYLENQYILDSNIGIRNTKVAFVSTNSISQGEQVGILWQYLISKMGLKISFAHTTFRWSNEARGVAAVYCVIVGFSKEEESVKRIFVYDNINGEPHEIHGSHINPYLVDGKDIFIRHRQKPICQVPEMSFGNMPLDGGNLLLSPEQKDELLIKEPGALKFIKPLISAREFLNNEKRFCLWLINAEPSELRRLPLIIERIEKVRQFRLASVAPSTQKFASVPSLFRDRNNPRSFILIPSTSSENRKYIPFGFFTNFEIANNSCHIIPDGKIFHFGVLTSEMHMTWVKYVCGRLKSDFRYSKDIVYNNFPWPENPTEKQKEAIEKAAQKVLDVRKQFEGSSLADLYNPLTMPPDLVKAHNELDKAVDLAYRPQPFANETKRIEYLFELYDKYTAGLFPAKKGKKR